MVKAVYFDVGSTLVIPSPDIDGMLYRVACRRGHVVSLEEVSRNLPAIKAFYEGQYHTNSGFWRSRESAAKVYLEMYRLLCRLVGLEADAEGIAREVHRSYQHPSSWAVFDDVVPCLEALQGLGLRLGVISNWAPNLKGLLDGLGIGQYFEDVVASAAVGCCKPDSAIFELALGRMGVAPQEAVHVGDRLDADGAGAYDAGLAPVIIDRHGSLEDCGFTRVSSLAELPALVAAL